MKKFTKMTIAVCMLVMMGGLLLAACSDESTPIPTPTPTPTPGNGTGQKGWETPETVEHGNFKDLGNYVIELPDITDASVEERALAVINEIHDHIKLPSAGGCTAMARLNSNGEVIFGRNMDLDISQKPAYLCKTTYGKYKTFGVTYMPGIYLDYSEIKSLDMLDEDEAAYFAFTTNDCLNEKGLYIEMNLRERNDKLLCYGLHSTHGETNRSSDGKPWRELRAPHIAIGRLVAQNCATVQEAVEYLNNSYDWYTITPEKEIYAQNNMAFMIGDATGEYGLIEIAQDEVHYTAYQRAQANSYIYPKWEALETCGTGRGRLRMAYEIGTVETLEDAMDAMKPIMWRNETLWLGESHRLTEGKSHPYNQIVFQDGDGNPTLDWRGDYVISWPVLDDGRVLCDAQIYADAERCKYDRNILKYLEDAKATGRLIVDDGSIKFTVNGEQLTLTELNAKNSEYETTTDKAKRAALQPYNDEHHRIMQNDNNLWIHNDDNFEAAKAMAYAMMHIRYNAEGKCDPSSSCLSKYEKMLAFYGLKGRTKDEKPLRDAANVWTTSLNVGVNCAQKELKIRFWENDALVYHFKW